MLTIGDFARHGRVSVRMLRHYDAIGLLRPAHVDPSSGYRFYKAAQLSRLNRIVALKDLGFTLQQVQAILDEDVSTEELRGMLRLRRAELEAALAATASGLAQVEARLRLDRERGFHAAGRRHHQATARRPPGRAERNSRELQPRRHRPAHRPAVRRAVPTARLRRNYPGRPAHRLLRDPRGRRVRDRRARRPPRLPGESPGARTSRSSRCLPSSAPPRSCTAA